VPIAEVVRIIERTPSGERPPVFDSLTATGIFAPLIFLAVGTTFSAIIAAGVGIVGAIIQRYRGLTSRSN
jgi:hypothetical protein